MPLQKQVIFRVLATRTTWNGVSNSTEVTLAEDAPQPDAEPINVIFRALGEVDAASFPAGKRVIIVVGADPAPDKAAEPAVVTAAKGILATAADWLLGNPADPKP